MADPALERYTAVARILHWGIALLIILNLLGGLLHEGFPREQRAVIMGAHMALGLLILALSVLRLLWRVTHRPPPLPAVMTPGQQRLAHGVHWLFYALMILVPLLGWIMVSAGPYPISWFGLFEVPKFAVMRDGPLAEFAGEGHELLGIAMAVLLIGHVAAALWHQFRLRDNLFARMR